MNQQTAASLHSSQGQQNVSHEKNKMRKLNDLVSDYRKENEKFVEKVSKLQKKLGSNHSSVMNNGINPLAKDFPKERMESTTSYFSDEDEAVREFAYGKMKRGEQYDDQDEQTYDEGDCYEIGHSQRHR